MEIKQASTQYEFFSLMQIRCQVFMCEQKVDPMIEMDDKDKTCIHYIVKDHNMIIATCRVIVHDKLWHLGRIAVLKQYRGQHYGSHMLAYIIEQAKKANVEKLELGAQLQAIPFYESLGFKTYGEIFFDADIEHKEMELIL